MSLSDCPKCWDTPCTCKKGTRRRTTGYRKNRVSISKRMANLETENAKLKAEVIRLAACNNTKKKK